MFVQCVRIMYIAEFFVSCLIDYDHILVNAVISGGYLRVGIIPPFLLYPPTDYSFDKIFLSQMILE